MSVYTKCFLAQTAIIVNITGGETTFLLLSNRVDPDCDFGLILKAFFKKETMVSVSPKTATPLRVTCTKS